MRAGLDRQRQKDRKQTGRHYSQKQISEIPRADIATRSSDDADCKRHPVSAVKSD
jgi:hypothetical protein